MSFSQEVKDELIEIVAHDRYARIAELSALISFYAKVEEKPRLRVILPQENKAALRKCFTLLNKAYNIDTCVFENSMTEAEKCVELNAENCDVESIVKSLRLNDPLSLLKKDECKRAYLRGAFIASGFVFEPEKSYQMEISAESVDYAKLLILLFGAFGIEARQSIRKKNYLVYVKGADTESDVLNVIGAHKAIMVVANARIMKDFRNDLNRRTNIEASNIAKTVVAALKQTEDILFIKEKVGLGALPEQLRLTAEMRLEYPEVSLTELGMMFDPPVGKSGINHRLRKISEFADGLR